MVFLKWYIYVGNVFFKIYDTAMSIIYSLKFKNKYSGLRGYFEASGTYSY